MTDLDKLLKRLIRDNIFPRVIRYEAGTNVEYPTGLPNEKVYYVFTKEGKLDKKVYGIIDSFGPDINR